MFCFSKRRCDALADSLHSLDMTSGAEKAQVPPHALIATCNGMAAHCIIVPGYLQPPLGRVDRTEATLVLLEYVA